MSFIFNSITAYPDSSLSRRTAALGEPIAPPNRTNGLNQLQKKTPNPRRKLPQRRAKGIATSDSADSIPTGETECDDGAYISVAIRHTYMLRSPEMTGNTEDSAPAVEITTKPASKNVESKSMSPTASAGLAGNAQLPLPNVAQAPTSNLKRVTQSHAAK